MKESRINKLKENFYGSKPKTSIGREINDMGLDRYIEIAKNKNMWKKLFVVTMLFNVFLVGVSGYISTKRNFYPYVIEIDRRTGEIFSSTVLKEKTVNVDEREIKYFLTKFISDTRTITLDKNYFNDKLKEINYMITAETQKKLVYDLSNLNVNDMFIKKLTQNIQVKTINRVSKDTYQVRWEERIYTEAGTLKSKKVMSAILNIDFYEPTDENTIIHNPFGIVIKDFNVTPEQ